MTNVATVTRPVLQHRQFNPFSRAGQARSAFTTNQKQIYEDLATRASTADQVKLDAAVDKLKAQLNGSVYAQTDFGTLRLAKLTDLWVNVDNQRDIDWGHIFYIIPNFDPRIAQCINVIELPDGRLSIPEGQHTAVVLFILHKYKLLPQDFEVQCKVIHHSLAVPGSPITGEAYGNLLFRIINHKGRKDIAAYYLFRSRVNGVRLYDSILQEDVHAEMIQQVLDKNNMFAAPAHMARGMGATPGMVTYISGLMDIAEHDTESFDDAINDLDWALRMHNTHFYREKGVDGGFILAFGRYAKKARQDKVNITPEHEKDLMAFFKQAYGSPKSFHANCKSRLKSFQTANTLPETWSDSCLCPVLIMDFAQWCSNKAKQHPVIKDAHLSAYYGI